MNQDIKELAQIMFVYCAFLVGTTTAIALVAIALQYFFPMGK